MNLAWEAGQKKSQATIDDDGAVRDTRISETQFREATNEMLVIGEMPLSFFESLEALLQSNRIQATL